VPLYEYACGGCGDNFTLLQSMNAPADEAACPECGSAKVDKQFSAFSPSVAGGGGSTPPMPPCGMAGGGGGCGGGGCGM